MKRTARAALSPPAVAIVHSRGPMGALKSRSCQVPYWSVCVSAVRPLSNSAVNICPAHLERLERPSELLLPFWLSVLKYSVSPLSPVKRLHWSFGEPKYVGQLLPSGFGFSFRSTEQTNWIV